MTNANLIPELEKIMVELHDMKKDVTIDTNFVELEKLVDSLGARLGDTIDLLERAIVICEKTIA